MTSLSSLVKSGISSMNTQGDYCCTRARDMWTQKASLGDELSYYEANAKDIVAYTISESSILPFVSWPSLIGHITDYVHKVEYEGRTVVIKTFISSDVDDRQRFFNELKWYERLSSVWGTAVVKPLFWSAIGNRFAIGMECGESLPLEYDQWSPDQRKGALDSINRLQSIENCYQNDLRPENFLQFPSSILMIDLEDVRIGKSCQEDYIKKLWQLVLLNEPECKKDEFKKLEKSSQDKKGAKRIRTDNDDEERSEKKSMTKEESIMNSSSRKESTTKDEEEEKEGHFRVNWEERFIPVPIDEVDCIWMTELKSCVVYRNSIDLVVYTMVPQPSNRFLTAIRLTGDKFSNQHLSEQEKKEPLVAFRERKDVLEEFKRVANLHPTGCLEINVLANDLFRYITGNGHYIDSNNREIKDPIPPTTIDDSNSTLWKLYSEKQAVKIKELNEIHTSSDMRIQVAKLLLQRDAKFFQVVEHLVATWKLKGQKTISDYAIGHNVPYPEVLYPSKVTLNCYEKILLDNGQEAKYHQHSTHTAYGVPLMQHMNRLHDEYYSDHDKAWCSPAHRYGNPFYIDKKDSLVHLSKFPCGPIVSSRKEMFTGCLRDGDYFLRHTTITMKELFLIIDTIRDSKQSNSEDDEVVKSIDEKKIEKKIDKKLEQNTEKKIEEKNKLDKPQEILEYQNKTNITIKPQYEVCYGPSETITCPHGTKKCKDPYKQNTFFHHCTHMCCTGCCHGACFCH